MGTFTDHYIKTTDLHMIESLNTSLKGLIVEPASSYEEPGDSF